MGLLDRAVLTESIYPLSSEEGTRIMGDNIGLLERPARLLSALAATWNVKRGALLVLDRKNATLVPSEIAALDTTTRRRLVLEKKQAELWFDGRDFFQLRDRTLFTPYYSTREVGLSSSLLGIAFRSRDRELFAVLLFLLDEDDRRGISDEAFPYGESEGIQDWLRKALFPMERADRERILFLEEEELQKTLLTEGAERILLRIRLKPLLEYIFSRETLKESFDSRNEVLGIFSSFFNERVQLYIDGGETLYILQPRELFPGARLMQNQVQLSLEQLLGEGIEDSLVYLSVLPDPGIKEDLELFLRD